MKDAAFHLLAQLVRKGLLDVDDIAEMADRLTEDGNDSEAHEVRAAYAEALIEPEKPEPHLVLVPRLHLGPDGGNDNGG